MVKAEGCEMVLSAVAIPVRKVMLDIIYGIQEDVR